MKISVVVCLFAVLGVACAANVDNEVQAEADAAAAPYDPEEGEGDVGVTTQALQSGGGGLGAKPWCAARKTCYDKCDTDYPGSPGPLATCKKLCDTTTASKCRPGAVGSFGTVIF